MTEWTCACREGGREGASGHGIAGHEIPRSLGSPAALPRYSSPGCPAPSPRAPTACRFRWCFQAYAHDAPVGWTALGPLNYTSLPCSVFQWTTDIDASTAIPFVDYVPASGNSSVGVGPGCSSSGTFTVALLVRDCVFWGAFSSSVGRCLCLCLCLCLLNTPTPLPLMCMSSPLHLHAPTACPVSPSFLAYASCPTPLF
jgi:hypothetical protein